MKVDHTGSRHGLRVAVRDGGSFSVILDHLVP